MVFLLALAVILLKCIPPPLLKPAASAIDEVHNVCLRLLPVDMNHHAELAAILCGEAIEDSATKNFLRASSLVHLFLLSGTQLFWLSRFARVTRLPRGFTLALASLWAVAGKCKVTFLRPLGNWFLRETRAHENGWRADQRVLWAGLLMFALFPDAGHSLALIFGWTAALAYSTPGERGWRGELQRAIWLWILFCPLLAFWNPVRPIALLFGLVLANFFSPPLLVTGVLACLHARWSFLFDAVVDGLRFCTRAFPPPLAGDESSPASLSLAWAWVFLLQATWHFRGTRRARRGT